jgi:hypothetical protein
VAGWLVDTPAPGQAVALFPDRPALLVVDYADGRVSVASQLARHLLYRGVGPPVRILLLARSRGDWWDALLRKEPLIETTTDADVALGNDPLTPEGRSNHFQAAARTFAAWLGPTAVRPATPNLSEEAFRFPLLVHIFALLSVLGEKQDQIGPDQAAPSQRLLDGILRHEAIYWANAFEQCGLPQHLWRSVVAVASLAGAKNREELKALLTAISDLEDANSERLGMLADALHELYPGTPYLAPLEPDLLTEHLVASSFADVSILVRVVDRAQSSTQTARLLTVLVRSATSPTVSDHVRVAAALYSLLQQRRNELLGRAVARPATGRP